MNILFECFDSVGADSVAAAVTTATATAGDASATPLSLNDARNCFLLLFFFAF